VKTLGFFAIAGIDGRVKISQPLLPLIVSITCVHHVAKDRIGITTLDKDSMLLNASIYQPSDLTVLRAAEDLRRVRRDEQLESREGFAETGQRDALPPWVEVEIQFVDEHYTLHARRCFGSVDLVEHHGTPGDVGHERYEYVVSI